METAQSHFRSFRRRTSASSRQWMPTTTAPLPWRKCRLSCAGTKFADARGIRGWGGARIGDEEAGVTWTRKRRAIFGFGGDRLLAYQRSPWRRRDLALSVTE